MKHIFSLAALLLLFAVGVYGTPSNVTAFHRSGQTFITWTEDGGSYDVYRYSQEITSSNITSAIKIGATIPNGSGACRYGDKLGISRVVLNDRIGSDGLATQLAAGSGLFVYTVQDTGVFYYAVTSAGNQTIGGTAGPISDTAAPPKHIVAKRSANGGFLGMVQYMDYSEWYAGNDGYNYVYGLQCPSTTPGAPVPLVVYLHGYGGFGNYTESATTDNGDGSYYQITIDDRQNTWFYGFQNASGSVGNYTEARVIDAVDYVRRNFPVDSNRIFVYGASMGGSGSLILALRYPNVFAACMASKGMTDYSNEHTGWHTDVEGKWGTSVQDKPITNIGRLAGHLKKYDNTPVFTWMNHHEMLKHMVADETAFISSSHGSQDESVIYPDQGQAFYKALNEARRGFVGWIRNESHSGANFTSTPNIGHYDWMINNPGQNGGVDYRFRKDCSFPAFSNSKATGDYIGPANGGTKYYHWHLMWGCPWINAYATLLPDSCTTITDTDNEYKIWIQSYTESGAGYLPTSIPGDSVDITPRRLQHFKVVPGNTYEARNVLRSGIVFQTQNLTPDSANLLTFKRFVVMPGGGWLHIRNTTTLVEQKRLEDRLMSSYCILLNSPNPCNPSTDITYRVMGVGTVRTAQQVSLRIYDVHGTCVCTLAKGVQQPGEYHVVWTGRDGRGRQCASGVYVLRLSVGDEHYQRSIVLGK